MSKSALEKLGTTRALGDTAEREIGLSCTPNCRKGNQIGQAMVEYILLIGLLSIILLGALIGFRDSVLGFTRSVVAFFQSASGPPVTAVASLPPVPAPAPTAVKATPKPSPTKAPAPDPASQLAGLWCAPFNNVQITQVGPGLVNITRVYHDGRRVPFGEHRVESLGASGVRVHRNGTTFHENYQFLNPNTFRINGGTHGHFAAPGDNFVRC